MHPGRTIPQESQSRIAPPAQKPAYFSRLVIVVNKESPVTFGFADGGRTDGAPSTLLK